MRKLSGFSFNINNVNIIAIFTAIIPYVSIVKLSYSRKNVGHSTNIGFVDSDSAR